MSSGSRANFAVDSLFWLRVPALCLLAGLGWFAGAGGWASWASLMVAVAALAATAVEYRRAVARLRLARQGAAVTAALHQSREGWLVVGGGGEIVRTGIAFDLLGPADDPLQPLVSRAADDERAHEELERLRMAARHGGAHRAEIALVLPRGGREWLALGVHAVQGEFVVWTIEDVSGRRAIKETLKRDHEVLADYLDFMPVGFYSADAEGRIRHVNQRLAEWVGRSADELVGMDLAEVLGVVPDPEEDRAEMRLKGRNDDVFQAFVTHTVFDEGGETLTRSVIVRDLMPERRWERALKTAERRFHWLFEDSPVGILLVDPDGTVNLANGAFAAMTGVAVDEIPGRAVTDFILPADRAAASEQLSRVLMDNAAPPHLPVRLAGEGRELVATLHVSPTVEDGAMTGLMLHFIDTTAQKHLEIQFAQSQKMQAMGQLAGGIAHDFNNLLTAMIGFCDLLLQRHGPGDASLGDVMQIKQNANRAASLVRQLLAFSRRQALQPRLFDVTDALADLSNLLRRLLGETIELSINHGRDLGLVRVDPGQFDQVIINLAVNARDAMPGGGQLSIGTRATHLDRPVQRGADMMPPGDYVLIEVADSGTGISPENLGRIFEPFFSTKEVGAGTGLGLSTVYGILRQTGGFVFVDSAPGQGAKFSIYLPRFAAGAATQTPARAASAEPAGRPDDLTGKGTVLLVEDEDAVRLFGARALRNQGYTVLEARSGENALDVLRAEDGVDVLVTDVVMPGMDGTTLARLVRMERPHIQVILMSGYAENTALGEFSGEDGIHFLPKPFSLKQLAGKVKDVLERPR